MMLSRTDTDKDGKITSAEFAAGAPTGPDGSKPTDDALTELFNQLDADGDGSLTRSELSADAQKRLDEMRSAMLQLQEDTDGADGSAERPAGPPPGPPPGGAGGPNGAGAGGDGQSASSEDDELDTNHDGVVSLMEKLAGGTSSASEAADLMSQIKAALSSQAYLSLQDSAAMMDTAA